jgi:hypothetical protein
VSDEVTEVYPSKRSGRHGRGGSDGPGDADAVGTGHGGRVAREQIDRPSDGDERGREPGWAYEIHSSNGGSGDLLLSPDGSFSTDYGDSGIWLSQGTAVAMRVNTVDGDEGCLYLGSFTKRAINSAHAQGPTNCGGSQDTWYAVRLTKKKAHATVRLSASPPSVPTATTRKKTEEPAPDYLVTWDSSTFNLTVSTDGLLEFQQTGPTAPVYDGFWVVPAKVFEVVPLSVEI